MSRIFATGIFLLCNLSVSAQSLTFDELLNYYEKGSKQKIDDSTAFRFFGFQPSNFSPRIETGEILMKSGDIIGLTSITPCIAGGMCENRKLTLFTTEGEVVDKLPFEYYGADCVSKSRRRNIYTSDTLLIFNELDYEVDECGDDDEVKVLKHEVQLEYVFIENWRFQRPVVRKIDTRRKYFVGSSEFLTQEKLAKYSKEELSTIRNEIFAAHGYTFDTPKWQQYFGEQEWYEPVNKEVDQYLSMIERHNIQVLLKAEQK